ncbi:MAG TPA: ATP-binding protein [Ignavibacteria bacterium]|nr:ATP-binding protein [Ignavibacteria bacterium]
MEIIPRPKYFGRVKPFIKKNIIKVLVGQRRTGKSFFLKWLQKEVLSKDKKANIIYLDKELYKYDFIKTEKDLFKYLQKRISNNYNYIFIDEVQEINGFEKILRDLINRKNVDIYITGSNARIFSSDLATFLSGRYIEIKVNPLSYNEFLNFHNLKNNENSLTDYLKYGGMPYLRNLTLNDDNVFPYLKSIYDTILLKDIVARYKLRNVEFLIRLTFYLAENTGNIISAKKISDYLKSQRINIPVNTIINYIGYLTNTFLIDRISRQEIEGKKVFEINEKFFFEDFGLRNSLIGFKPQDISKILENAVYMHLIFLGYQIKVGVTAGKGIDFVASKNDKKVYIQACYLLADSIYLFTPVLKGIGKLSKPIKIHWLDKHYY